MQNFVCFSSAVVRRGVFEHVGQFDPQWDLAIDYDLWLRVAKHYAFDFVDEELVRYRTGHGNLSKKLSDRVDTALSIMHRAQSRYGVAEEVPAGRIAEAYASTCRTLAYVMRGSEPAAAAAWYLRALGWHSGRLASIKGLVAVAAAACKRSANAWLTGERDRKPMRRHTTLRRSVVNPVWLSSHSHSHYFHRDLMNAMPFVYTSSALGKRSRQMRRGRQVRQRPAERLDRHPAVVASLPSAS